MKRTVPPRQARSARTNRQIIEATDRLLRHKRFDAVTITEIANEAGLAQSSVYTRFRRKDLIFSALVDDLIDRAEGSLKDRRVETASGYGDDLTSVVYVMVRSYVGFYADNQHIFANFEGDKHLTGRRKEWDRTIVSFISDTVFSAAGVAEAMSDPAVVRRAEFAVRSVAAIANRALGSPVHWANEMGLSHDELAMEITKVAMAYFTFGDSIEVPKVGVSERG